MTDGADNPMAGWQRCRFAGLLRVVEPGRGWALERREIAGKTRLALVSPRGPVWELRVRGGWWLRRVVES